MVANANAREGDKAVASSTCWALRVEDRHEMRDGKREGKMTEPEATRHTGWENSEEGLTFSMSIGPLSEQEERIAKLDTPRALEDLDRIAAPLEGCLRRVRRES